MEKVAFTLGKMGKLPMQKGGKAIASRRGPKEESEECAGEGKAPDVG